MIGAAAMVAAVRETPARPSLYAVAACSGCGAPVTEVRDLRGCTVRLERERVADGEWWAVRVGGQWRVTRPRSGDVLPERGFRYAEHSCPPAAGDPALEVAPASADAVSTAASSGWILVEVEEIPERRAAACAGGCGARVRRYGPGSVTVLCPECREVLEAWRAGPRPAPLPIPYGRRDAEGKYVVG